MVSLPTPEVGCHIGTNLLSRYNNFRKSLTVILSLAVSYVVAGDWHEKCLVTGVIDIAIYSWSETALRICRESGYGKLRDTSEAEGRVGGNVVTGTSATQSSGDGNYGVTVKGSETKIAVVG